MKVRYFLEVLLSLILLQVSHASFERREQGARPIGMGGAFTGIADNTWAMIFNPAGLAQLRAREFSAFYSPQPFGLSELSLSSFSFVEPTAIGNFGISAHRFGFELYREISATISYANSYREIFFFGLNVSYHSLTIKSYGSASTIGIDLGLMTTITPGLRWGFFAANINAPSIGQAKEKLPQVFSSGIAYVPVQGLLIAVDLVKDVRYPVIVKAGVESKLVDVVSLRAGVGSNPTRFSSGLGVHYSSFQFDYALTAHQDLGLSHQFSVTIHLSKGD